MSNGKIAETVLLRSFGSGDLDLGFCSQCTNLWCFKCVVSLNVL